MNRFRPYVLFAFLAAACCLSGTSDATDRTARLTKRLTADESRCLQALLIQHFVQDPGADKIKKLVAEASVARAHLSDTGARTFIFVIHDVGYCGSAGCLMLIGERRRDGSCYILTEANNDGDEITVLTRRDHGYHRLYAPCELYFDGRQYQQVRAECPTLTVQR